MKSYGDDLPDSDAVVKKIKEDISNTLNAHMSGLGGLFVHTFQQLSTKAKWIIVLLSINAILMATTCILLGIHLWSN